MNQPLEQLLDRARNGDADAFAEVFEEYRPLLYRIAYRIVGPDDCDDVVMDTYLKVWKAIPRFKGQSAIKTWLCKVTKNCALDHIRKRQRESARTIRDEADQETSLMDRIEDRSTPEPDKKALLDELGEMLQEALSELSDEHRTALLLREVDGLSYRDIAASCGVSIGTVMSRLFYARRRLQKILRQKGV